MPDQVTAHAQVPDHGPSLAASEQGKRTSPKKPLRLVIVGFGMAAFKLVEQLSVLNARERFDITVLGKEPYPAYNRIHLTAWLDHGEFGHLALEQPGWNRAPSIRVLTGHSVTGIDRDDRTVETAGGERIRYDRLVLATGAAAFHPPIEGADCEGVFVYRTLDDLKGIRARSKTARDAIVVGGGLLGIETAGALHRMGLEVTLLESGAHLMKRHLDPAMAAELERDLTGRGIPTLTGSRALRIDQRDDRLALTVSERALPLVAGMIVFAAGVRPRDELARQADLEVNPQGGGIVIDDQLRTTDPAIYAIGDCASHEGVTYGLVAPGYRMSETLAGILAGQQKRFSGYVPAVRLRLSGIDVWSLGKPDEPGVQVNWGGDGCYRRITVRATRLRAAAAIGSWQEIGQTQDMIRHQHRPSPTQLYQFMRTGTFSAPAEALPVTDWAKSTIVCHCLEVTRGALGAACDEGCALVEELAQRTGASTVCGSCKPMLAELLGGPSSGGGSMRRVELLTAAAAAAVALILAGAEPTSPSSSVQAGSLWDTIYRNGVWRQATGFGLLGSVATGAAAYSLRKRWSRLRWGNVAWWRVGHSALAVVALALLVAHTGLRLGSGFNRVLMIFFLATTLLGAAAAAGFGLRHARTTFWLHLVAAWPLPALLMFHILTVYYF